MTTPKRINAIIAVMEAAVEEAQLAIEAAGAEMITISALQEIANHVHSLRERFDTSPQLTSQAEIITTASMLKSFMLQSIYDIRRYYRELDSTDTEPLFVVLADGQAIANGSVNAQ